MTFLYQILKILHHQVTKMRKIEFEAKVYFSQERITCWQIFNLSTFNFDIKVFLNNLVISSDPQIDKGYALFTSLLWKPSSEQKWRGNPIFSFWKLIFAGGVMQNIIKLMKFETIFWQKKLRNLHYFCLENSSNGGSIEK